MNSTSNETEPGSLLVQEGYYRCPLLTMHEEWALTGLMLPLNLMQCSGLAPHSIHEAQPGFIHQSNKTSLSLDPGFI